MNLAAHIARRTAEYASLPVFRAFAEDRIPLERFRDFFEEQAMAARFFQDFIWAATAIDAPAEVDTPAGRRAAAVAAFAREHRRVDSGHYRWTARDLATMGLPPLDLDRCFALGKLDTRIQLARILACFHDASAEARLTVLAALESAGAVTLGTLFAYAERHGLAGELLYLGRAHVHVEERQVGSILEVAAELFSREDPALGALVDTVFDALSRMFQDGGRRIYGDLAGAPEASHAA